MIITLSGRRIDKEGADVARFPFNNISRVKEQIAKLFTSLSPSILVCSGACGSDLLALQVAGDLNIRRGVVLPFDPEVFKKTSVTDRPGNWGHLFDSISHKVKKEEGLVVKNYSENDKEVYRKTNIDILERAKELATKYAVRDLAVVIVWDGNAKEEDDTTKHFKREAEKRNFQLTEIKTL